jgi:hypothetical protein
LGSKSNWVQCEGEKKTKSSDSSKKEILSNTFDKIYFFARIDLLFFLFVWVRRSAVGSLRPLSVAGVGVPRGGRLVAGGVLAGKVGGQIRSGFWGKGSRMAYSAYIQ